MSSNRTTIIRGPAIVTYDSVVMYTEGDITFRLVLTRADINVSAFSKVDERLDDITTEVSFTPAGVWAYRTVLLPHTTPSIGSSIIGATDKDLVIHTLAGKTITVRACAITSMPQVNFGTTQQLWGAVTFTGVGTNTTAWSHASKRVLDATATFSDTSFDPTAILTQPYTVAWGASSPWNAITTEDGVRVSFELDAQPVKVDSEGTVDMTLENVQVIARMKPVGVSEADVIALLKAQDTGAARGVSLQSHNSAVLNISGTGVYFRIYKAAPVEGPLAFGRTTLRAGELAFIGTAEFATGARQPLYYHGTAAPT